ncbi:MAG: NPCBM/NEW2 domain-containing protein [Sedimentisphaerales bacterium]|nr:NPCBM/NEW2 domain-containing protein [Sedimentisphaerales bacterium]
MRNIARCAGGMIVGVLCLLANSQGRSSAGDIPIEAPNDAVMASAAEVMQMSEWSARCFGAKTDMGGAGRVEVKVLQQDYNALGFGRSCMETPITIGARRFAHGLGTHANSRILVHIPPGARRFEAMVGIDNNYDTQGKRGSVIFAVEIGGEEVYRSAVVRGPDEAAAVGIDIPAEAKEILLKAETTDDGPSHDHADWADARFIMEDGSSLWLDDNQSELLFADSEPPFSFVYGGIESAQLLGEWEHTCRAVTSDGRAEYRAKWSDPATGLEVTVVASMFEGYPAVDWVAYFENKGDKDTPIIEDIQALDVRLRTGPSNRSAVVHGLTGDMCSEQSWLPTARELSPGKEIRISPVGGRSSNGAFGFFNFEYGGAGFIMGIGWSGQWAARFERSATGPSRVRAGMERTHLVLRPGERIRSPRIVVLAWKGERHAAHNRFRRLLLFHYVPKEGKKPVRLPTFMQCFDRYSWTKPGWATEAGQLEAAGWAHRLGFDFHWFDAAWFVGGFPNGVGNWYCKPKEFPNGLRPIGDACHNMGIKFVVWFEPERVAAGTQIEREHPEFIFTGEKNSLFKLNDPVARRWMAELLSKRITEFGMDWYRNDFNIDPLPFWRKNDAPDRQGMTEIRYVEGLYELWDGLRERNPGLYIDNCASGGRRIDLETCMRSVPFWRSDTGCAPGRAEWDQSQTAGLSLYLPLHCSCGWSPQSYVFRSAATAGMIGQWDYLADDFDADSGMAALAEFRENQKYWYGDFYALTPCDTGAERFVAYQFHRADLHAGLVLAFRRGKCAGSQAVVHLEAVDSDLNYSVEFVDEQRNKVTKTMVGAELAANLALAVKDQPGSLLVRYERLAGNLQGR